MLEELKLCESDYRFACIIWEREPLGSGELVKLCAQHLGWKKSTTYTVLKKLCARGFFKNDNSLVTSLIKQEQVQRYESEKFIERTFGGSLPHFITAFMNEKTLSPKEAEELKKLIDQYKEG
ncbi:BlaI/MecI/CopY family transcriptional regulator [Clostridium aminobutyricum]|uniref:BlaI/MecI/CopY family transcriptional regulator n=1 Tax=Clostridium aminobutyricum TaxID=33953 RepID=A0A939D650_CLOAM|nr:BlaI/MecI/CopY family transcriptional regulator [Clostridium aminobutyricum]MBN7771780.1 BlaI/MecI/CopY family transcriptional regulator [Clostridium aminobutyricum]